MIKRFSIQSRAMIESIEISSNIKNTIKSIKVAEKSVYFMVKDCLYQLSIETKECNMVSNGASCFDVNNFSNLIIGELSGKVKILFNNSSASTTSHWHSQKVNKVLSINNGASVLSGGNEVIKLN